MKKYSEAAVAVDIIKDGVYKGVLKATGISMILGTICTAAFIGLAYVAENYTAKETESEFNPDKMI